MNTQAKQKDDYAIALESGMSDIRNLLVIMRHAINDKEEQARNKQDWGHIGDLDPIIKNLKEAIAATGYLNTDNEES